MTKDKDIKTVVPALRFPEFRDAERWDFSPINDVCHILNNRRKPISEVNRTKGDYPYYGASGIVDYVDDYIFEEDLVLVGEDGAKWGAFEKSAFIAAGKYWVNNHAHVLKAINVEITVLQSYLEMLDMTPYITGAAPPKLTLGKLKEIKIPISRYSLEQKKIADCFGSLDDLISAVADKIEALKEHKKGLMQQLFPADGKTTPILRFPEFQNAGNWIETTLGEEVYYENGKAHENDIDEAGQYIVVNSKFISTDGEVIKYTDSPSCLADKGDILMVLSDVPNGRAIAKCFIVDSDNKHTVNQRICKLKPKKVVGLLLYYIINRNPFLLAFDDGIKQTNLKKDDVLNCPFRVPKDPKEQQRIADCLLAVDELTSAEADKLNQLKAHKKGLMQQLFPTINK